VAIQYGHHKLAGKLMAEQEEAGMSSFNFLHKEVILFCIEFLIFNVSASRFCFLRKKS
jgi:hypothetical protein